MLEGEWTVEAITVAAAVEPVVAAAADQLVGDDGDATLGDLVKDESERTPFESLRTKSDLSEIAELLAQLDPREADIMVLRFGLNGESPLTLEEVGVHFKLTRERVRQIEVRAFEKLQKAMREAAREQGIVDAN